MNLIINPEYDKLVPTLSKTDYSNLKDSILKDGLWLPVVINSKNEILDGHNRHDICVENKIPIKTIVRDFESKLLEKKFVIECNLHRRHLNDFQKIELGIPLLEIERELAQAREKGGTTLAQNEARGKATEIVAKQIGVSRSNFEKGIKVIDNLPEKLKDNLRSGKTSINYAYKTINRQEKKKNAPPIPQGKFNVILADPPWKYDINIRGSPDEHYDVMDDLDIVSMDIPSADDCVLFMWGTAPKLKEALEVIESWGFTYKTNMVWVKNTVGTGFYFRGKHELLLVAVKGNISIPEEADRPESVLIAPRTKHSKKPEEIYSIIERMYPDGTYLELFARNTKENWKSWGNEI